MKKYIKLFEEFVIEKHIQTFKDYADDYVKEGSSVPSDNYIGHNIVDKSFGEYREYSQSMTNFSIGDRVRCIDPRMPSFEKTGKIIAFEDSTIRWREDRTDTYVGIDGLEYRCKPQHLQKIYNDNINTTIEKYHDVNTQFD